LNDRALGQFTVGPADVENPVGAAGTTIGVPTSKSKGALQGEVPAQVLATAANKNPPPPWLKDADQAKGHPNSDDLYNLCIALENSGLAQIPRPGEKRMFS